VAWWVACCCAVKLAYLPFVRRLGWFSWRICQISCGAAVCGAVDRTGFCGLYQQGLQAACAPFFLPQFLCDLVHPTCCPLLSASMRMGLGLCVYWDRCVAHAYGGHGVLDAEQSHRRAVCAALLLWAGYVYAAGMVLLGLAWDDCAVL
jgi:hypothetical protein